MKAKNLATMYAIVAAALYAITPYEKSHSSDWVPSPSAHSLPMSPSPKCC